MLRSFALAFPLLLEVTVKTASYFDKKTTKLTQDICPHDNTDAPCSKNDINSFLKKMKLRSFAFARQHRNVLLCTQWRKKWVCNMHMRCIGARDQVGRQSDGKK